MPANTAIVDGTLYPDGKVQLDEMPGVAPGRVTVFLQPIKAHPPARSGLAETIDEIRQGQEARGFHGRSAEEIDAARRKGEDAYERDAAREQGPNANPS